MKSILRSKIFLLLVLSVLSVTSCKMNDFGDLNVDTNKASNPSTAALFTAAMRNARLSITDDAATPILWAQHWSEITYTTTSIYGGISFNYSLFYTTITNLNYIIQLNTDEATKIGVQANGSNNNQIAVARILKAALFQMITDRWGDVPYSEALKGKENFRPKFDKQQDIYNDLFKELKQAEAQIGTGTITGDIILGGNVAKWKKYATSLRMVMALRLSKVDPAKGKAEFAAAFNDGVLSSNSDNVVYKYLLDANNQNPWYASFDVSGRLDYAVSKTLVDYLKPLNDPRLAVFANKSTDLGDYIGMPYGLKTPGIKPAEVSLPGKNVRLQNSPSNFLTYTQILFCEAEAAKLGWISADPKALYESAIKASFDQWGVYTADAYNNYISTPTVAYNDADALQLIGTQKWVALYMQGYEAWAEWRRTGYPALSPAPSALNPDKQIPRRQGYPTTERDLNSVNYKSVLTSQGPDAYSTHVWWDK